MGGDTPTRWVLVKCWLCTKSDTGELLHSFFTPTRTGVKRRANVSLSEEISGSRYFYYHICFSLFALPLYTCLFVAVVTRTPSFQSPRDRTPARTALHCTTLHYTALHCNELHWAAGPHPHLLHCSVCVYDCLEQQIFVCDQKRSLKSLFQRTTELHVGIKWMRLIFFILEPEDQRLVNQGLFLVRSLSDSINTSRRWS